MFLLTFFPLLTWTIGMIRCVAQWKLTDIAADFFPSAITMICCILYCTVKANLLTFSPSLTWTTSTSMICCIAQWKLTDVSAEIFPMAYLDYQHDMLYCTVKTDIPTVSLPLTDWLLAQLGLPVSHFVHTDRHSCRLFFHWLGIPVTQCTAQWKLTDFPAVSFCWLGIPVSFPTPPHPPTHTHSPTPDPHGAGHVFVSLPPLLQCSSPTLLKVFVFFFFYLLFIVVE